MPVSLHELPSLHVANTAPLRLGPFYRSGGPRRGVESVDQRSSRLVPIDFACSAHRLVTTGPTAAAAVTDDWANWGEYHLQLERVAAVRCLLTRTIGGGTQA